MSLPATQAQSPPTSPVVQVVFYPLQPSQAGSLCVLPGCQLLCLTVHTVPARPFPKSVCTMPPKPSMEVSALLCSRSSCQGPLPGKDTTPGTDLQLLMQYLHWVQGEVAPARCGERQLPLQQLLRILQGSLGWGYQERPGYQERLGYQERPGYQGQSGYQEQPGYQNLVDHSEGSCHSHLQLPNFES